MVYVESTSSNEVCAWATHVVLLEAGKGCLAQEALERAEV